MESIQVQQKSLMLSLLGTTLRALFFLIYMNEFPINIKHSKVKIFTDDTRFQKIIIEEDRIQLQSDIHAVSQRAYKNKMQQNEGKSELIHFGKNVHARTTITISWKGTSASN